MNAHNQVIRELAIIGLAALMADGATFNKLASDFDDSYFKTDLIYNPQYKLNSVDDIVITYDGILDDLKLL